jgi:hypothetical protein
VWKDPESVLHRFELTQGHLELGFGRADGQTVGTSPLMCRIVSPGYPDEWFSTGCRSQHTVTRDLQKGFIPDWFRAQCYEHAWRKATGQ